MRPRQGPCPGMYFNYCVEQHASYGRSFFPALEIQSMQKNSIQNAAKAVSLLINLLGLLYSAQEKNPTEKRDARVATQRFFLL